jgi:hypothetical protein
LIAGERFFCFVAAQKDVNRFEGSAASAEPCIRSSVTLMAGLVQNLFGPRRPKGEHGSLSKRQSFGLTA